MMRFSSSLLRRSSARAPARHAAVSTHLCAAFSSDTHLTKTRFDNLAITENSKRAIRQELKYEYMTDVQQKTFAHILEGKDVLSKAKTGNGKTMAFLLPAIERMVSMGLDNAHNTLPMLVISPTRELALQIATEARKIGQFHDLNVACFVGGTSVNKDTAVLKGPKPVDILVATPGRLLDHLNQDSGHIVRMLRKLHVLVLDEADRLLDMGFRNEIMKILKSVPDERQTLLFSATLPKSTQELTKLALRDDYELVNTVTEGDQQTNEQVTQEYVVCAANEVTKTVESLIRAHIDKRPRDYKVMLFFPTARAAQFMAQLFASSGFKGTLEMHSRKSQAARTKTAAAFHGSKRVLLFSSDVSARGVDYPDVTLVVQVGLTDRDQYIHRLGRTARGGSDGHGVLVLADFEKPLLNELRDLPLKKLETLPDLSDWESATAQTITELSTNSELEKSAKQSYQAWLGFYNSNLKRLGLDKVGLVELAESYSQSIGLQEPPRLDLSILRKMGLFGTPGLEPASSGDARYRGSSVPRKRKQGSSPTRGRREVSIDADEDSDDAPQTERRARSFSSDDAPRTRYEGLGRGLDAPRKRYEGSAGRGRGEQRAADDDFVGTERRPRSFSSDRPRRNGRSDEPRQPYERSGGRSFDGARKPYEGSGGRSFDGARKPYERSGGRDGDRRGAPRGDSNERRPRSFSSNRGGGSRRPRSSDGGGVRSDGSFRQSAPRGRSNDRRR